MGQDPNLIRRDIEQTREQMSDTVEALGYKADVPSRTKESIQGKVDSVRSKVTGAAPDGRQMADGAKRAAGVAQGNPLGLAIGAAAVGFLVGMLVPETQKEHEVLGETADQVKQQARDTAQTAVEHGKQAAQEVAQSAAETAKETAQDHGQQVAETAQDNAQQVTQS
jgi:hypothetical protein